MITQQRNVKNGSKQSYNCCGICIYFHLINVKIWRKTNLKRNVKQVLWIFFNQIKIEAIDFFYMGNAQNVKRFQRKKGAKAEMKVLIMTFSTIEQ